MVVISNEVLKVVVYLFVCKVYFLRTSMRTTSETSIDSIEEVVAQWDLML